LNFAVSRGATGTFSSKLGGGAFRLHSCAPSPARRNAGTPHASPAAEAAIGRRAAIGAHSVGRRWSPSPRSSRGEGRGEGLLPHNHCVLNPRR
jgi:hypothetical protein